MQPAAAMTQDEWSNWGQDPWAKAAGHNTAKTHKAQYPAPSRPSRPSSHPAYADPTDPRANAASLLMIAVSSSGASRHVVASTASALFRLLATTDATYAHAKDELVEQELQERLSAVAPALRAQLMETKDTGHNSHSCRGLVGAATQVRRNAALHATSTFGDRPFSELSTMALRQAQRGTRGEGNALNEYVLEDLLIEPSETRMVDTLVTDAELSSDKEALVSLADFQKFMNQVAADNATCIQNQVEAKFDSIPGIIGVLLDQKNATMAISLSSSFQKELRAHDEQWQNLIDTVDQQLSKRIEALEDVLAATRSLSFSGLPLAPGVPPTPSQCAVPCKFFQSGECNRGDACRFSHAPTRWSAPSREATSDIAEDVPDALHAGVPQIPVGATVRIMGIVSCPALNDRLGVVKEHVPTSGRYRVQVDPDTTKALRDCNLQYPARCPSCGGEVTSSKCFSCMPAPSELPD